jgi:putative resolvase
MKLSQYAKKVGVTYRTAFRWWKNGQIKGYQLPSGTIVMTAGEERQESRTGQVVIYARVASHEQRAKRKTEAIVKQL